MEDLNELLTDREIEAKEVMGELGDAAKFVIDYLLTSSIFQTQKSVV